MFVAQSEYSVWMCVFAKHNFGFTDRRFFLIFKN